MKPCLRSHKSRWCISISSSSPAGRCFHPSCHPCFKLIKYNLNLYLMSLRKYLEIYRTWRYKHCPCHRHSFKKGDLWKIQNFAQFLRIADTTMGLNLITLSYWKVSFEGIFGKFNYISIDLHELAIKGALLRIILEEEVLFDTWAVTPTSFVSKFCFHSYFSLFTAEAFCSK